MQHKCAQIGICKKAQHKRAQIGICRKVQHKRAQIGIYRKVQHKRAHIGIRRNAQHKCAQIGICRKVQHKRAQIVICRKVQHNGAQKRNSALEAINSFVFKVSSHEKYQYAHKTFESASGNLLRCYFYYVRFNVTVNYISRDVKIHTLYTLLSH